jgi:heptose I phosphotransferase
LQGEVYRELEGRRTLRTEVDGNGFFVKIHRGIGWGEIFKNLLTAKLPVLGAGQEWQAIQRLQEVGVPTMTAVAYGERGSNPADQHSFIVTEELAPTVSLEDFSIDWVKQPPEPPQARADRRSGAHDRHDAPRRGQPPRLLHLPLPAAHRQTGDGG